MKQEEFARLAGVSKPTMSRWLATKIPTLHQESLWDLLLTLEKLYKKLYPLVPDTSDANFVLALKKFRTNTLLVSVIDLDKSGELLNNLTRDERESLRQRMDAGIEALQKQITGEQNADTANV
jgi:hypothetical protein